MRSLMPDKILFLHLFCMKNKEETYPSIFEKQNWQYGFYLFLSLFIVGEPTMLNGDLLERRGKTRLYDVYPFPAGGSIYRF